MLVTNEPVFRSGSGSNPKVARPGEGLADMVSVLVCVRKDEVLYNLQGRRSMRCVLLNQAAKGNFGTQFRI